MRDFLLEFSETWLWNYSFAGLHSGLVHMGISACLQVEFSVCPHPSQFRKYCMGPRRSGPEFIKRNWRNIWSLQLHITKTRMETAKGFQKPQTRLNLVRSFMTDTVSQTSWIDFIHFYVTEKDAEAQSGCVTPSATWLISATKLIGGLAFLSLSCPLHTEISQHLVSEAMAMESRHSHLCIFLFGMHEIRC